ncbi:MAG: hypothetical protein OXU61_09830, partial [Gammaproteobacteria bacterium]|nr:hypothetical protein [Gammaproteobacteria bacterium]
SGATANSQDGARLDVSANGVWGGRFEKTFFDVRVFNPYAPSNNQTPSVCYRKHEQEKNRAYEQRICEVEHSSFTPLVFSATGGMGREATCFYKRLASMLAQKWDHRNYSQPPKNKIILSRGIQSTHTRVFYAEHVQQISVPFEHDMHSTRVT